MINLFINSKNFDIANIHYNLYIQENLSEFNSDHFEALLNGINENNQCSQRGRARTDNTEIIYSAIQILGQDYNFEEKYPYVKYYKEN